MARRGVCVCIWTSLRCTDEARPTPMNLLLLEAEDFTAPSQVHLNGRRAEHVHETLKVHPGQTLRVGRRNGLLGVGTVRHSSRSELTLDVVLTDPPPPRAGVDVVLAMPRPKALKKVLPALASLGVSRIVLLNAAKVEKSYFTSKFLTPEAVAELLSQGLEQAQDTVAPEVQLAPRFRVFVEDVLPTWEPGSRRLLAHPHGAPPLGSVTFASAEQRCVIAIGPEGGWVPFELDLLQAQGFEPFSLGPRTLRVETVVPYLLGQLQCQRAVARGPSVSNEVW